MTGVAVGVLMVAALVLLAYLLTFERGGRR